MKDSKKIELARKTGLTPVGKNEDGEIEFIGSDEQFDHYEELVGKTEEEYYVRY